MKFFLSIFLCLLSLVGCQQEPPEGVALFIPARLESKRMPRKLLAEINGRTIIERIYERAKWAKSVDRVVVLTDSPIIAEKVGEDAVVIEKHFADGTERISDAIFNHGLGNEKIIVDLHAASPFFNPEHIDFAVRKYKEVADDPAIGAVFLHYKLGPEEAQSSGMSKLVIDQTNRVLYGSRFPLPHGDVSKFNTRAGIMVYKREALEKCFAHARTPLRTLENLEWLKLLELGYTIKSFEAPSHVERYVDVEEDLVYLQEKYQRPRVYIISGKEFSPYFIERTNTLWNFYENDRVVRCSELTDSSLELLPGHTDVVILDTTRDKLKNLAHKNAFSSAIGPRETLLLNIPQDIDISTADLFRRVHGFERVEHCNPYNLIAQLEENTAEAFGLPQTQDAPSAEYVALSYVQEHYPGALIFLVGTPEKKTDYFVQEKERRYIEKLEDEGIVVRLLEEEELP